MDGALFCLARAKLVCQATLERNFFKARSGPSAWRRNRIQGLLTFREDVTVSRDSRHAYDWDYCEEISILVYLLKKSDFIYFSRSWRDIWQAIMSILAVCIINAGGYWTGAIEEQ